MNNFTTGLLNGIMEGVNSTIQFLEMELEVMLGIGPFLSIIAWIVLLFITLCDIYQRFKVDGSYGRLAVRSLLCLTAGVVVCYSVYRAVNTE